MGLARSVIIVHGEWHRHARRVARRPTVVRPAGTNRLQDARKGGIGCFAFFWPPPPPRVRPVPVKLPRLSRSFQSLPIAVAYRIR